MANGFVALPLTFGLAWLSATFFLVLRCQGVGRPFGPCSRRWAFGAIALTSIVSTAAAVASVTLTQYIHPAFFGAVAPSGLWLGQLRRSHTEDRRTQAQEPTTLGLAWFLERMHQGMAEDRLRWCEDRVDRMWRLDQLTAAARYYHEYLKERLSPVERRHARVNARLKAIEDRLDVVRIIENGASAAKVLAAMRASRVTKERRYERYRDDLMHLASLLRHDGEQDLIRLLSAGYQAGCYRLRVFAPPVREPLLTDPYPTRPHP